MLMTGIIFTLLALYILVTGFALVMTLIEQRQTNNTNPVLNMLSFVACVLWPLTVLVAALLMQRRTTA